MSYEEAIDYLYEARLAFHLIGAKAYKPGLETTRRLLTYLGNPETQFQSVHVAGTNGKGSTSHLIAAALQSAGLRVGLFTSPHLVDFCERIRINGQMIPQVRVAQFVTENKTVLDELKPSFFECTTALAFQYFAEQKVDVAVVEVGLGGRLDSTNVITPLVSVITNIGLDHTEFLGTTLSAIAEEKAGIIKPGVPCVIGESQPETMPVFERVTTTQGSRLIYADQCEYLRRLRRRTITDCELQGGYQEKNQQTAYVSLRVLRDTYPMLTEQAIADGFAHVCSLTGLRGRWEVLSQTPLTICDTGHNAHGISTYVEQLKQLSKGDSHLRIVFGMVSDKDIDAVLSLLPLEAYYYWTEAATNRAVSSEEMCRRGLAHGLIGKACGPVEVAIKAALKDASAEDVVFIGGSNYVVGEGLRLNYPIVDNAVGM